MTHRSISRLAAAAVAAAIALAGCSTGPAAPDPAAASSGTSVPQSAGASGTTLAAAPSATSSASPSTEVAGPATSYPLTLESPYGKTTLNARPERVAVVSSVDLDIALALGVIPVTSPRYGDTELDPWSAAALKALGGKELTTYDSADGTDVEAIMAAKPDVILATSGWTLDEDYAKLSKIAPVVSYQGADGLSRMSWAQRTDEAAKALDRQAQGKKLTDDIATAFAAAATAHPEFKGKTITYAVLHPSQITYNSYQGSDMKFFNDLGFVQPAAAAQFSDNKSAVSRENVNLLDADVLLVAYPFAGEGVMTRAQFEADPLVRKIPAVAGGHYAVVDDSIASPLAYPTPLAQVWVLEQLLPVLTTAVAGK